MNKVPIPTFHYQDADCQLLIGPAFYGAGPVDMFGISEQRAAEFIEAMKNAEAHFCDSPTCPAHSNVLPKFEMQHPSGARLEEMFNAVCYPAEPTNARELAFLVLAVAGAAMDQLSQQKPNNNLAELMQNLFSKKESNPESAIADLLKHKSDGNSQFGLAIDPTEYKLLDGETPWDAFHVSEQKQDEILKAVIRGFSGAANDLKADKPVSSVMAQVFNGLTFSSVAEQNYASYLIGIYSAKLGDYYAKAMELGVGKKLDF